ncbi:MAG: exonuclease SbcCD subunit D [Termitinemataceae bacterium]|nr:MAG: exonuclease SbcCD subunit D [Termitinemataceae bacterium]
MTFLHLSDLHIGKTVNGFSMLDEQRSFFKQVIKYIQAEKPAAVIIAGDVYDRAVPGIESVIMFDDFLTELSNEDLTVIIVSGNHDSPERLNFASRLLTEKQIHVCGMFDGKLRSLPLHDEYGDVHFWLLPFIKPASVRDIFSQRVIDTYDDALLAALESANIDYAQRNVLVSHQFFTKTGANVVRSDSELNLVGGLDAMNVDLISRFDYAALGHLHGAQSVAYDHICYAGSPLKYSFSEQHQKKSVSLVKLREKGSLTTVKLPITPLHDMRQIKGKLDDLTNAQLFERDSGALKNSIDDYLHVVLTDCEEITDPMGKLRSIYPNIMALDFENSRTNIDLGAIAANSEKIETLSVYDLFCNFFLEASGSVMSNEQSSIVREMLEQTKETNETS